MTYTEIIERLSKLHTDARAIEAVLHHDLRLMPPTARDYGLLHRLYRAVGDLCNAIRQSRADSGRFHA